MNAKEIESASSAEPTELDYWLQLWALTDNQSHPATKTSLEVIIRGLQAIKSLSPGNSSKISSSIWTILGKMAQSPNDGKLFKEAGNAYLRDFRLGHAAKEHLERAWSLGCSELDLQPLIAAADAIIRVKGAEESGVAEQRQGQKTLSNAIRRTGKLGLVRAAMEQPQSALPRRPITLPADPKICLQKALEAIELGTPDPAKKYLSGISGQSVDQEHLWDAWTQLGELYFESGQYGDSVAAYQSACNLFPDLLISQFNLGTSLQLAGNYEDALDAYERADSLSPNHPKVWCNIGSVFFLMEKFDTSELALQKAVSLKPDYARAWDNLAGALGAQGKIDEAEKACKRAIAIRPDYPEPNFKLAIIYFTQRKFELTLPCFAAAAAQRTLSFYTNCYLAMTLAEMGNMGAAERALEMAGDDDSVVPELLAEAWGTVGRIRLKMFEFKQAITSFQEACRLNPASQHWLDLGLAHQFAREDSEASECFSRAMKMEVAA